MIGAPALLFVHPTFLLMPKMPLASSSFLSCFFCCFLLRVYCFVLPFLPFVLVFHCWERWRFNGGESVIGQWLLRLLVRFRRRYTRYAFVGWVVIRKQISTYELSWSVSMKFIHIKHTDQLHLYGLYEWTSFV